MTLTINPVDVSFTIDFVEFTIDCVYFAGEFKETATGFEFILDENYSDDEAADIYTNMWELINDELTYIYFHRPTETELKEGYTIEKYKGCKIVWVINDNSTMYGPVYNVGFDIIDKTGFSFGHLFDYRNECFQAIDEINL